LDRRSKSIYDALLDAFSQTVDSTGIAQELTDEEKTNFAARFEEDAETFLKHAGISRADMEKDLEDGHIDIIDETLWQNAIKHALQQEKPVCTEKFEESINSAQQQFQISCKGWKNSSVHDAHKLLGVPENNQTDPSFIERRGPTSDYEHMFDASITPPSQFDGRTAFPACSDVVGRVHDQGTCGSCWAFAALGHSTAAFASRPVVVSVERMQC
jgi:C1A family cysteine protease